MPRENFEDRMERKIDQLLLIIDKMREDVADLRVDQATIKEQSNGMRELVSAQAGEIQETKNESKVRFGGLHSRLLKIENYIANQQGRTAIIAIVVSAIIGIGTAVAVHFLT